MRRNCPTASIEGIGICFATPFIGLRCGLWLTSLLVVLLAHVSPSSVEASSGRRSAAVVGVAVRDTDTGLTSATRDALESALKDNGRFAVLSGGEAAEKAEGFAPRFVEDVEGRINQVRTALAAGEDQLFTDPSKAVESLKVALRGAEQLEHLLALPEGFRDHLFVGRMRLARAHIDSGSEQKAREVLQDVLRVHGSNVSVTESRFHPNLVRVFEEVHEEIGKTGTGTLQVESLPVGTKVVLNGRVLDGVAPTTVSGLTPGVYRACVWDGGRASAVHEITVAGDGASSVRIDHAYESRLRFANGDFGLEMAVGPWDADALVEPARQIGRDLDVDVVVLTGVVEIDESPQLVGLLIDVQSGAVVHSEAQVVSEEGVSDERVRELASALAVEQVGGFDEWMASNPWAGSITGWSLAVGGVAAVAVRRWAT